MTQLVLTLAFVLGVAGFGVVMVVMVVRARDRREEYRQELLSEIKRLSRRAEGGD
jgi:preprotein translocase subunit YajC